MSESGRSKFGIFGALAVAFGATLDFGLVLLALGGIGLPASLVVLFGIGLLLIFIGGGILVFSTVARKRAQKPN